MSYFNSLKSGDTTFSSEHGLVTVLMVEERNGVRYVTCETNPNEDDNIVFDAIEGELTRLA